MSEEPSIESVVFRAGRTDDLNFIYSSWLKGLRYGNDWFEAIDQYQYFRAYHQVLENVLIRPNCSIKVACLASDPDVILGYSVFEGSKIHWIFVKRRWRGIGLGKQLLPVTMSVCTHLTKIGKSLLKKFPDVRFNPFEI